MSSGNRSGSADFSRRPKLALAKSARRSSIANIAGHSRRPRRAMLLVETRRGEARNGDDRRFEILWCGRLGCSEQARRLHHKHASAEKGSDYSPHAAEQAEDQQGAPEADRTFAGQQRGVGRQRTQTAVGRGPAPEEPLGVAAVAKTGFLAHGGVVRPHNALRLRGATEAGVPKGQRHVDPRQRIGRPGRKAADRFQAPTCGRRRPGCRAHATRRRPCRRRPRPFPGQVSRRFLRHGIPSRRRRPFGGRRGGAQRPPRPPLAGRGNARSAASAQPAETSTPQANTWTTGPWLAARPRFKHSANPAFRRALRNRTSPANS